jgi:hypothetical protein
VAIRSHPFFDPQHGPNTNVVPRASDAQKLQRDKRAVKDMLLRVRDAQSSGAWTDHSIDYSRHRFFSRPEPRADIDKSRITDCFAKDATGTDLGDWMVFIT